MMDLFKYSAILCSLSKSTFQNLIKFAHLYENLYQEGVKTLRLNFRFVISSAAVSVGLFTCDLNDSS